MEICTVGGYEEVGKNMTAVKVGDDVILLDAGLYLPAVVELQEQEIQEEYSEKLLRRIKAIPNDLVLDDLGWSDKVRAIIIGHAHLDHVGAVPYLVHRYPQAEIIASPFTMAFLKTILRDEKIEIKNPMRVIKPNSTLMLKGASGNVHLEFIHTTHSTLQCIFVAWHSSEGTFLYTPDFKFDNYPIIGEPPNYKRLKELGKKGVKVLVADTLYSGTERRTASERIARNLLEDAFSSVRDKSAAMIVTTFSSHIARLKSIVEFGKRTHREIIFLGRSLNKYVSCASEVGLCPFYKEVKILKYRKQINSFLKRLNQERGKFLVVCTGHQAEPGSILDRITNGETPFQFHSADHVIFSSSVIPVPINIAAREKMDLRLKKMGVRIQTDIHVSGHGGREDLRDLVQMLDPQNIIPAHGSTHQEEPMVKLAEEMGYEHGKNVFLSNNGKVLKF